MNKILFSITLFGLVLSSPVYSENKAPELGLSSIGSGTIQLSNYKGKVIYLDFWATWCVPCRKSFPWMNEMLRKYQAKGLEIIAVSLDEKTKMVETFLKRYPADFTIALDQEGRTADLYQVRVMPSSYIIDREGKIIESHMGFRNKDKAKLESLIQKTLSL